MCSGAPAAWARRRWRTSSLSEGGARKSVRAPNLAVLCKDYCLPSLHAAGPDRKDRVGAEATRL